MILLNIVFRVGVGKGVELGIGLFLIGWKT